MSKFIHDKKVDYGTIKAAEKEIKRVGNNIKFYINLSTQLREKYNFLHTSVFNSNGEILGRELCQIEDKLKGALHYFYFAH